MSNPLLQSGNRIILGVDPGSNLMGYAFLQVPKKGKPRVINIGVIDVRKEENHPQRLRRIYEELQRLIGLYEPTEAAIEAPFYGKDAQSMLKLGRAQGTAMAAMAGKELSVIEYSPRSIKKAVTGKGNATKEQLANMLPHVIQGEINAKHMDETDALGVAFCHYIQTKSVLGGSKRYSGWDSFLKDNPSRKTKLR